MENNNRAIKIYTFSMTLSLSVIRGFVRTLRYSFWWVAAHVDPWQNQCYRDWET